MKLFFEQNKFKLYQADCIDFMKQMKAESVDMIFADPPYCLSNGGFTCKSGKAASVNKGRWDTSNGVIEDFEFHLNWLAECHRILKPNGTIWISGTYHSIYKCGYAMEIVGYHILNDIAWFKPNAAPNLSCRYFTASHETLIWARKSKKAKHKFNYKLMKNGDWLEDNLKKDKKQMRSVWSIATAKPSEKKLGKHPTQKPLSLLERALRRS